MTPTEIKTIVQVTVSEMLVQLGMDEDTISDAQAKRIYKSRLKEFQDNGIVSPVLIGTKKRWKIIDLILASNSNYKLNKYLIK